MTFVRRRIDATITLGEGSFGEQAGDSVLLTGLRVRASIASVGGEAQGQLQASIYGIPMSMGNQLTTIGPVGWQIKGKNSIQLAAGNDDGGALSSVFVGTIINAWVDTQQAPEIALSVFATSAAIAAVKPVAASSYAGTVQVAQIMSDLAGVAGYTFENAGVQVTLNNPYFHGSALDQIKQCARAARIGWTIDNGVLAIWPPSSSRGGDAPVISPGAGLVGYPAFNEQFVIVRSEFLPGASLGRDFTIAGSAITPANGTWHTAAVAHEIESETPGGAWFTDLQGYSLGD